MQVTVDTVAFTLPHQLQGMGVTAAYQMLNEEAIGNAGCMNTSSDSSRRADHVGVRRISRRCQLTALHQWHVLLCQDAANGSLAPLPKARSQSILTLRQRGEQPQVQR